MTFQTHKSLTAWTAFSIASAFFLYEFVARIEPSLATGSIATRFNLSNAGVGTLSSLFFWIYAPMQLIVGMLLDRFGARRLVVPAIAICASGIAVFAASTNPLIAALGRLLTGLGASFAFVGALYVVNHRFSPNRFALLSGLVNTIGMFGTAIGAVALTTVIEKQGWQSVFFATSGVGVALFLAAFVFFHDADVAGKHRLNSAPAPSLRELISGRRLWMVAIAGSLYYMPVNVFGGLWGQSDLSVDHGLQPVDAETAVSMIFWGMAVGSVGVGAISDWLGHRKWLIVSGALLAAVAYAGAIYSTSDSVVLLSSLLFAAGLFSGAQMLTFTVAKEGAPAAVSGTIIAFVNMVGIAGAIVFQPLIGEFLDVSGGRYRLALATIPVCLILAAATMIMVDDRRHADHIA